MWTILQAAGLAHTRILEYLLTAWPDSVTDCDFSGKTPLHWASSAKNNSRAYNLLVQAGADEEALDYVSKLLGCWVVIVWSAFESSVCAL